MKNRAVLWMALIALVALVAVAFAQDGTAPDQWSQWAGIVRSYVVGILQRALPGIDGTFASWVGGLAAGVVTWLLIHVAERVSGAKAVVERGAAGVAGSGVGVAWARWRAIINPILAVLVGFLSGGPLGALFGPMVHAVAKAPSKVRADIAKIGGFLLVALSLAAAAAPSHAASDAEAPKLSKRLAPSFGVVARKLPRLDVEGAAVVQVGYALTSHVAPRVRYVLPFKGERRGEWEAGLFVYF